MLLNLVLDTNTWIYLSNGFNTINNKIDENLHFELLEKMLEKVESGECHIYSNYIIKKEWKNNKDKTKSLINKYKRELEVEENKLKKYRGRPEFHSQFNQFNRKKEDLTLKIQQNEKHIQNVDYLINRSIEIPVKDKHKLDAVELALDKKPPFHKKENSVADAIIFLSTIDYFFYEEEIEIDNTIFVSNNSNDFGESISSTQLHPELAKMVR